MTGETRICFSRGPADRRSTVEAMVAPRGRDGPSYWARMRRRRASRGEHGGVHALRVAGARPWQWADLPALRAAQPTGARSGRRNSDIALLWGAAALRIDRGGADNRRSSYHQHSADCATVGDLATSSYIEDRHRVTVSESTACYPRCAITFEWTHDNGTLMLANSEVDDSHFDFDEGTA